MRVNTRTDYEQTKSYGKRKKVRASSTGFKGVRRNGKGYQAQLTINAGDKILTKGLGTYDTPGEAYMARIEFIKTLL